MCTSLWLDLVYPLTEQTVLTLGYVGIGVLTLIETAFSSLPSELVIPFVGILMHEGRLSFAGVLFASTLGTLLIYLLGRALGEARLRRFKRWGCLMGLDEAKFDAALAYFRRYEASTLFWGRPVPGSRSVVSLPAGVARTPLFRLWFYSALGSLVWNATLLGLGVWLGELDPSFSTSRPLRGGAHRPCARLRRGAIFRRHWRRPYGLNQPLK